MIFLTLLKWGRRVLITLWFWVGAALATLLLGICVFAFGATSHNAITALIENIMAPFIFNWMTLPGFWQVDILKMSGLDEDKVGDAQGPYLLAANHNSIVDTLFMALLPFRKSYTFNLKWSWVPIFGPLCVKAGYVGIDLSNPEQKARVVDNVVNKMRQGYSMMIYPQGTRSSRPEAPLETKDLKHGAFTIAFRGPFKILPIAIKGTDKALMRGGWADVATIEVIMCHPIEVINFEDGKKAFCNAINGALNAKLKLQ